MKPVRKEVNLALTWLNGWRYCTFINLWRGAGEMQKTNYCGALKLRDTSAQFLTGPRLQLVIVLYVVCGYNY